MPLFSLIDQPNLYRCVKCGSCAIEPFTPQHPWRMPANIKGYVMPTVPEPERDNFGPITTRTVRCR